MTDRNALMELAERLSPEAIEHAFDRLNPYHGKTNTWGAQAALLASTKILRLRLGKAQCDHEAVSDCVACNTMFLVRAMEGLLCAAALRARASLEDHSLLASKPRSE